MSIFNKSFDADVAQQLKVREQILSSNYTGQRSGILESRPPAYLQYANNKTPFIRLSSGVDVINPILQKYFNITQQDELATRFILEGGTLLSNQGKDADGNDIIQSTQRYTFTGNSGIYGANDLGGTSDFGLRPMPGISGISVKSYGENISTLRIATVTLDCYTIQQLEALELLYMRPGYRVLLEWGHTQYWVNADDFISQQVRQAIDLIKLDITKESITKKINKYRKDTSYNYDAMFGKVRNFSWEAQTNGSYRCTLEIISLGDIIDSLRINVSPLSENKTNGSNQDDNTSSNDPVNASSIFTTVLDSIIKKSEDGSFTGVTDVDDTEGNWPGNLKNKEFKTFSLGGKEASKYVYISLKDLLFIINESGIYLEGNQPIINIYYKNLKKCLSHPYQISGDPRICITNTSERGGQIQYYFDVRYKNDLDTNFPYRDGELFSGNMGEILVNINHCKELFRTLISSKNNKLSVILKDFIQSLMDDISNSMGDINNFQVVLSADDESIIDIIDYNFVEANVDNLTGDSRYYTIPLMGIGTGTSSDPNANELGGTYVRSYRLNTQLTNDIATTISIGAQAGDKIGVNGVNTSVFNSFNQGIKDRLAKAITDTGKNSDDNKQNENEVNVQQLGNNIVSALSKINIPYDNPLSATDGSLESLKANIRDLINYSVTATKENAVTFGSYTPVPLTLELTMDGIAGIKVGTIFLIPADRLPFQYKIFDPFLYGTKNIGKPRVGFIVFGVDHNVSSNNGWETNLSCKMVMLNPNLEPKLFDNNFQITNTKPEVTVTESKELEPRFKFIRDYIFGDRGVETPILVLENENGEDIEYLFASQNTSEFTTSDSQIRNIFQSEINKGPWEGFKAKFIPITNKGTYLFLGRYVDPKFGAPRVDVYFPLQYRGSNNIQPFTKESLTETNANLLEFYSAALTDTSSSTTNSKYFNGNVKTLWYPEGNSKLLTYNTNEDPRVLRQRRTDTANDPQNQAVSGFGTLAGPKF